MKKVIAILLFSFLNISGQSNSQIIEAKKIIKSSGMSDSQIKIEAKARGFSDNQIEKGLKKLGKIHPPKKIKIKKI